MVTEEESIKLVMDYEKKQGRMPERIKKRIGYDIKSGERFIEVKSRNMKYSFVFITDNESQIFDKHKTAYLYVVFYDKEGKTELKIFDRDTVLGNKHHATVKYRLHLAKAMKETSKEIDF
jgi:hypothetical protein